MTVVAIILLLLGVGVFIALDVTMHRAEPILRAKIIDTLSKRFDSRVELADFHVSVFHGLQVSGGGLTITPSYSQSTTPLFSVRRFNFSTGWVNLLRSPIRVGTVEVDGLDIRLPPKEQRGNMRRPEKTKLKVEVDRILITNAMLVLGTSKPGKQPLDFQIGRIEMDAQRSGMPWRYDATLVNPKPVGNIHAVGGFGPWRAETPGDTPLDGSYSFSDADLSTFKGIAGILSSTGKYKGVLNSITVDGQTDTPDFRLTLSGRPVPLHTTFHATVDGTTGDTYLLPVDARLLHSHFTATGSVVRAQGVPGHHISLDVVVDDGRIEDFLRLAVRADQPLIKGSVRMNTILEIRPGPETVFKKINLNGTFLLRDALFTSENIQSKLDELSLRGQGLPARQRGEVPPIARSQMQGRFGLANSIMTLQGLHFDVPGADISADGTYNLDGSGLDIHGKARLEAKLSQMTTGWKSLLLKPVDPFFAKNGAGTEVPFKITGTRSDMKFGLDFHHGGK